ncbi:MAG: hypothetical protein ACREP9_17410 [Candidatus Dormibacteraceae bacterium]
MDHWRCRFVAREADGSITNDQVLQFVTKVSAHHSWVHLEKLLEIDGVQGFTRDQGED